MRSITVAIMVFFGLVVSAIAETNTFEVITLKHRPAEELVPLIQPLMEDDEVVTGRGYQLIVRTSANRLKQIRTLLNELDTQPQRLLISVQQLDEDQGQQGDVNISGRANLGNAQVVIDGGRSRGGIRVESEKRQARRTDNLYQQIQVLDGSEAYIQTGQEIPYVDQADIAYPAYPHGRYYGYYSIYQKPVTSGFYVRPKVHGDWVTLEIEPNRDRESVNDGGRIITQEATTTVTGRLGEWLEISRVATNNDQNEQAVVRSTRRRDESSGRVVVKVDRLP